MNRTRYNLFSQLIAVWLILLTSSLLSPALAETVKIAIIKSHNSEPYQLTEKGFQQYLRKQKIQVVYSEYQLISNNNNATLVDQVTAWQPDLIFSLGKNATELSTTSLKNVPIITSLVLEKDSENYSGTTGVYLGHSVDTELKILSQLLPDYKKVGVLYSSDTNKEKITQASIIARKYGIEITSVRISSPKEIPQALNNVMKTADVIWGLPDTTVLSPKTSKAILLASFRNQIPFIGLSNTWVKAGALYSLDWDYTDMGEQAGMHAHKIIQGRPLSALKPSYPASVYYSLNLKTANHMKVRFSKEHISKSKNIYK